MNWLAAVAAALFAYMMYVLLFTRRGRGWNMGGTIVWSGEEHVVATGEFSHLRVVLQVHEIEGEPNQPDTLVGLEVRARTAMSYDTKAAALTLAQARALRDELAQALAPT